MKKYGLRFCIFLLVIACTLGLIRNEVLAWGPITHQKIVHDAKDRVPYEVRKLWTNYPEYMYAGAIAPDWCLAYALGTSMDDTSEVASHQVEFHSQRFLDAMKLLASTDEERAFYYAYLAHVMSDRYEGQLGDAVDPEPTDQAREFYIDKMIVAGGYQGQTDIEICSDLIVDAYERASPTSQWQPKVDQVDTLVWINQSYQQFWLPCLSEINVEEGYEYYSDYKTYVDMSIQDIQAHILSPIPLASIWDELIMILHFDDTAKRWTRYNPASPADKNTLYALVEGETYWIKVNNNCTLTYGSQSYSLITGWNSVLWMGH